MCFKKNNIVLFISVDASKFEYNIKNTKFSSKAKMCIFMCILLLTKQTYLISKIKYFKFHSALRKTN